MTIVVEHLARSFGNIEAVKGIDFEVGRGETFGFLGPNGAGKSTTIKMLCTLLHPTKGRAFVNGYDIERESAMVRRSIGIVFQDPTLDEYLTAEQNLRYHCMIYHTPRETREARIRAVLELVRDPVSLDAPLGEDGDATIGDLVADEAQITPHEAAAQAELRAATDDALSRLTPREADILRLRFGVGQAGEHTLEEVGRKYQVTRERIRQIEAKALKKLAQRTHGRTLASFVER